MGPTPRRAGGVGIGKTPVDRTESVAARLSAGRVLQTRPLWPGSLSLCLPARGLLPRWVALAPASGFFAPSHSAFVILPGTTVSESDR